MLLFLVLSVGFGLWVLPLITRWTSKLPISQGVTTLAIIILLVYGLAAELLGGMAAITGTFLAGLMFARTPEKGIIESNLHPLAYAFFVPIFFVGIGLSMDLHAMDWTTLWIMLGITVIAILGKIIGAGSGALLNRYSWREALQLGAGMVARGEVSLIIAKIGLDSGYLNNQLFTSIIGMILLSTLITPSLLRAVFSARSKKNSPPPIQVSEIDSE
jgi:Kef-type K+ transport system membrane component KefB